MVIEGSKYNKDEDSEFKDGQYERTLQELHRKVRLADVAERGVIEEEFQKFLRKRDQELARQRNAGVRRDSDGF
ncbi:MAG: hypothetical protein AAB510_02775 [Patescibacteria group bacterium]